VPDWERLTVDVREYMQGGSCDLVLIVTPEETFLFRDPLSRPNVENLEKMGPWPTRMLFGSGPGEAPDLLTRRVHTWLGGISTAAVAPLPVEMDPQIQTLIHFYVTPAVVEGRVLYGKAA
jgi:hypothetical protein